MRMPLPSQRATARVCALAAWGGVWWCFVRLEFGLVFFILSCILAMFWNTGATRGDGLPSAYHFFNRGLAKLPGSLDASQFENELRNQVPVGAGFRGGDGGDGGDGEEEDDGVGKAFKQRKGRVANKPCHCGSGKKFKRCCGGTATADDKEEYAQWERDWQ